MKNDMADPSDGRLRQLLQASRPAPALPPRFAEGVWRRIENAEPQSNAEAPAWLESLLALVFRPKLAFVAMAVLVITGAALGVQSGAHVAREQALQHYLAAVAPNPVR